MNGPGKAYGYAAALIIGIIPVLPLLFVLGWGGAHCDPVPECQRDNELSVAAMFGGVIVYAAAVGFGLCALLNRVASARAKENVEYGFDLTALTAIVTVAALLLLILVGMI